MRDGELIRRARWGARQGLLATLALCAAPMVQAQSVKPGLWEHSWSMKSTSGQMEKAMAQMKAELAKMPADQRKMMEQMMAKQGVGMSGDVTKVKLCLSPEQARNLDLPAGDGKCQQTVTQRSSGSIKSSFVCAGPPPSRGEGEMTLKGDTAYTGKSVIDTTIDGKPERMNMEVTGQWLTADCGPIKPIQPVKR